MKIAIIGGGAAGMMCAAVLAEKLNDAAKSGDLPYLSTAVDPKIGPIEHEIHIFDKNEKLGVKVRLTGGGRCNLTTEINDKDILLKKYPRGSQFLVPAMSAFPPKKVREWFVKHGLQTEVEENDRVFPKSRKSADVINIFEQVFSDFGVKVHYRETVLKISRSCCAFEVETGSGREHFDFLVITTGGNTFPQTGSTGDGYTFAEKLGHHVTKLAPSLNSFNVNEKWCKELTGLSFPNAKLSVLLENGEIVVTSGPTLFTHFGISGPNTFALASHLAYEEMSAKKPKVITFIPQAEMKFDMWNEKILSLFNDNGSKQVNTVLSRILSSRFVEKLLELANIAPTKKCSEITKQERHSLLNMLSDGIELNLTGRAGGNEFVTAGGVDISEVERKSMESKIVPGLFFAGEVLDVDGYTGGFNLQAAWATGNMAASGIINKILN